MEFRIADTFTDSLTRLTGDEQKAVKTTAFDLQLNPANPGMSFHKLDKAKDKNFWSVRVNKDIRLIVHRTSASMLLCSAHFLLTEWEQVVDAWQLDSWEGYRDVARLGRKTRLPEAKRKLLWSIFEQVRAGLTTRKMITYSGLFTSLAATILKAKKPSHDFAVVDEAQDISVAHLRFFA